MVSESKEAHLPLLCQWDARYNLSFGKSPIGDACCCQQQHPILGVGDMLGLAALPALRCAGLNGEADLAAHFSRQSLGQVSAPSLSDHELPATTHPVVPPWWASPGCWSQQVHHRMEGLGRPSTKLFRHTKSYTQITNI